MCELRINLPVAVGGEVLRLDPEETPDVLNRADNSGVKPAELRPLHFGDRLSSDAGLRGKRADVQAHSKHNNEQCGGLARHSILSNAIFHYGILPEESHSTRSLMLSSY